MFGYGPRYLHSTGQLHKGGPNTGVFVLISATPSEDLPIPDQAVLVRHARARAGARRLRIARRRRPPRRPCASAVAGSGADPRAGGRAARARTGSGGAGVASESAGEAGLKRPALQESSMQIGFVGLGKMGLNMVTRLVRGGHTVVAYDRSADAVARAEAAGAKGVSTLEALIGGLDRAARRLGDGAVRRSHRVDGRRARPHPCRRRRDHRRRQHQLSRRCAAGAGAGGQARRLRRRRDERRHLGPRRKATA